MIQVAKSATLAEETEDSMHEEMLSAGRVLERVPEQFSKLARLASGSFRLVHYVSLVAIVFVLGIGIVWLNISCVRTGYLIETKEVELKSMKEEERALTMRLEQMTSPLELRRVLDEMNIALSAGAAAKKPK